MGDFLKMGIKVGLTHTDPNLQSTPPYRGLMGFPQPPMHRSITMFKSFNSMLTNLFNGFSNLFESFSHITKVTTIYSKEMELTAELESGATIRSLTKQIALLEAA